jgi:sensor histidine kinase YesM
MRFPISKTGAGFGLNSQVAFWVIMLFILSITSVTSFGTSQGLLRMFLVLICHAITFYTFYYWLVPVYFLEKKYMQLLFLCMLFFTGLTMLRVVIEQNFQAVTVLTQFMSPVKYVLVITFSELLVAAFASLLRISVHAYENRQKLLELKQLHTETELLFLKSQLNPHFLFNTINNLYALSLEKSAKTPEALLKLSGLLRYYLYECNKDNVRLDQEWDALLAYKELFTLKYENPVHIQIHLEGDRDAKIEPMLLIPLLENCFKHSDIGISANAFISVNICQKNGRLQATFQNSFHTREKLPDEPGGIGIVSIQKRLQLRHEGKHSFIITKSNNIYSCELMIDSV